METINAGNVYFLSIHQKHITSTVWTNQIGKDPQNKKTRTAVDICTLIRKKYVNRLLLKAK